MKMEYFTKQSHLCFIMFEQLIELSLVKIELSSKMLFHRHLNLVRNQINCKKHCVK